VKAGIVARALATWALVVASVGWTSVGWASTPTGANAVFAWQGATGWLPLEFRSDHHAYLKLTANGHEAVAMIDPNLPHTTVDAAFAHSIGLRDGDALELGLKRLTFRGLSPAVKDLSPLQAALQHPVGVIIGADALSQVIADIDLPGHRIAFDDFAGYSFPSIARYTPLTRDGDVWLAPVSIAGHRSAHFALDLIGSEPVQIAPNYARSLALAPTDAPAPASDDGAAPDGRVLLRQMKFVGVVSTDVVADVPQQLRLANAGSAQGALGVGTLRKYRLILDLGHDRLYTLLVNQAGRDMDPFTLMRPPSPGNATPNFGARPAGGL